MSEGNRLSVFFIRPDENIKKMGIIKKLGNNKICYVCLSDTVSSVTNALKESGIDARKLCFIDTLSSHYSSKESTDRCIYISSPSAIDEMSEAILKMKEKCNAFVFDDISSLLRYHDPSSILMFTNSVKMKKPGKMVYIISKNGISGGILEEFIDDLEMFADETKDLTGIEKETSLEAGRMVPDQGTSWPYGMSGFDDPKI